MALALPPGYAEIGRWELSQASPRFWLITAVLSLAALILTWFLGATLLALVNGGVWEINLGGEGLLLALVLGLVLTVVLHELIHGIGFRACGARPRFGFKPWTKLGPVFYASAPGFHLRRGEYLVAGLAPLGVLTVALFGALALLPVDSVLSFTALVMAGLNVSGSVGDVVMARKVLGHSSESYFEDRGEGFVVYGKSQEAGVQLDR